MDERTVSTRLGMRVVARLARQLDAERFQLVLATCDPALLDVINEVQFSPVLLCDFDEESAELIISAMWDPAAVASAWRLDGRPGVYYSAFDNAVFSQDAIPAAARGPVRTFDDAASTVDPVPSLLDFVESNQHISSYHLCRWVEQVQPTHVDTVELFDELLRRNPSDEVRATIAELGLLELVPTPSLLPGSTLVGDGDHILCDAIESLSVRASGNWALTGTMLRLAEQLPSFAALLWDTVAHAPMQVGQPPLSASGIEWLTRSSSRSLDPARLLAGMLSDREVTALFSMAAHGPYLLNLCRRPEDFELAVPCLVARGQLQDWTLWSLPDLSSTARIDILASVAYYRVTQWLTSSGDHAPRPGEVAALVATLKGTDAGTARLRQILADATGLRASSADEQSPLTEFIELTLWSTPGLVREAFETASMDPDNRLFELVVEALETVCGSDKGLWGMALGLAPAWEGSLSDLVHAAATL